MPTLLASMSLGNVEAWAGTSTFGFGLKQADTAAFFGRGSAGGLSHWRLLLLAFNQTSRTIKKATAKMQWLFKFSRSRCP
jgi:hypothetical protein